MLTVLFQKFSAKKSFVDTFGTSVWCIHISRKNLSLFSSTPLICFLAFQVQKLRPISNKWWPIINWHFGVRLHLRIFEKKRLNARGFAREFHCSCKDYGPGRSVKRRSKSSSLHSKNFFLLGVCGFFVSDKWRAFRPPWPTLPGPGRQPLGGGISLEFLLQTRLQSESFDTLDDLLGFRVQKLWSKVINIFD